MKFDTRRTRWSWKYKMARKAFLAACPLCAECSRQGIITAAAELDHIVPAGTSMKLFWGRANWQGLCRSCHEEKTAGENSAIPKAPGHDEWMEAVKC